MSQNSKKFSLDKCWCLLLYPKQFLDWPKILLDIEKDKAKVLPDLAFIPPTILAPRESRLLQDSFGWILCFWFSLNPLRFFLTWEIDTKHQFLNDKVKWYVKKKLFIVWVCSKKTTFEFGILRTFIEKFSTIVYISFTLNLIFETHFEVLNVSKT